MPAPDATLAHKSSALQRKNHLKLTPNAKTETYKTKMLKFIVWLRAVSLEAYFGASARCAKTELAEAALLRHSTSCNIASMPTALKLLLFGLISASISTIVLPLQAKMMRPAKAGCCEHMTAPTSDGDCGGHPAKPSPDRQCCAACALGLTLFLATATPLINSQSEGRLISSNFLSTSERSDRPPVPPPRASLA